MKSQVSYVSETARNQLWGTLFSTLAPVSTIMPCAQWWITTLLVLLVFSKFMLCSTKNCCVFCFVLFLLLCGYLYVFCSNCLLLWHVDVTDPDPVQELVYDLRSQCDAIRVTKTVRPFSMVCCPVNENSAALIVSDGRVMIWELKSSVASRNPRNR